MILLWDVRRATVEWPGALPAEREYIHACQLNFWYNQCYNPFAHQFQELHPKLLPYWWIEVMLRAFHGNNHQTLWVCAVLHRHYAYAFDPCLSIFHRRRLIAVFWEPERVPVLVGPHLPTLTQEHTVRSSQRWAFRRMRVHARSRWLAAVRVLLLQGFNHQEGSADVSSIIVQLLEDWDVAQCDRRRGRSAADMPDRLDDKSIYVMEESVERALQGASITYSEGAAGTKRRRLH
jgi:hypothetical protein